MRHTVTSKILGATIVSICFQEGRSSSSGQIDSPAHPTVIVTDDRRTLRLRPLPGAGSSFYFLSIRRVIVITHYVYILSILQ